MGVLKSSSLRFRLLCIDRDCQAKKKRNLCCRGNKKFRYWPRYVDGEMIKNHFLNKEVGAVDAIKGRLDDMTVEIHCLKEPNYTMMLMSSYGT